MQLTACFAQRKCVLFDATKLALSKHVYFMKINKFYAEVYASYQTFKLPHVLHEISGYSQKTR